MAENISYEQEAEDMSDEAATSMTPSSLDGTCAYAVVPLHNALAIPFVPTGIKWLGPNLDLKIPPQNWLRGGSPLEKYVQRALYSRQSTRSHMSSFTMAHSNVHLVDSVDVISDAKNIKNLLKIPWAKDEPISLMIHRVGKTLLIDEFDIHKHLLRKQQHDWEWLKRFYNDLVREEQVSQFPPRAQQTQKKLKEQNIFSKFLYHSIMPNEHQKLQQEDGAGLVKSPTRLVNTEDQTGAEAKPNSGVEDHFANFYTAEGAESDEENEVGQQFVWKFEDIKMMIGNDLPIFTDESSCVSLRLRDASSPITVLTGLDYWLDNLMCNVPEIAMCYHACGFVQRYERLSTSEIPNIKGSEFAPDYVKDIAQNILSFLKSNATKMGHTYWLYKAKDSEIVKLYDLTSLTDKDNSDSKQNPFRHPLAYLLFRVALNLYKKKKHAKSGVIRELLVTSLALATGDHPKIPVTAYLILSELYLKEYSTDKSSDIFSNANGEDSEEEEESDVESQSTDSSYEEESLANGYTQLDVTTLSQTQTTKVKDFPTQFPPISGSMESRCKTSLQMISEALLLIDKDIDMEIQTKSSKDCPRTSSPSVPIPLPFKPAPPPTCDSKTDTDNTPPSYGDYSTPFAQQIRDRLELFKDTWHRKSKAGLLSNAMCAYYELALGSHQLLDLGNALKYCQIALLCFDAISYLDEELKKSRLDICCRLISLCGDINLNLTMVSNENFSVDLLTYEKHDDIIITSAPRDIPVQNYSHCYAMCADKGMHIQTAMHCYSHVLDALAASRNKHKAFCDSVSRRLANAYNEMASCILEKVAILCTTSDIATGSPIRQTINVEELQELMSKLVIAPESEIEFPLKDKSPPEQVDALLGLTEVYTGKAFSIFSELHDYNNMAVVTLNASKRLRLKIQLITPVDCKVLTAEQESFFNQSIEVLQNALDILGRKEACHQIWDVILYELSGANYNFALSLLNLRFYTNTTYDEKVKCVMREICVWVGGLYLIMTIPRCNACRRIIPHTLGQLYHNFFVYSQLGKRISEMLLKAVKLCESSKYNRNNLRLYRCAAIHHTLGQLYHNFFMYSQQTGDQQRSRHMSNLSNTHYEKSCKMFTTMKDDRNTAAVLIEKAALHLTDSKVVAGAATPHVQLRHLELALSTLLDERVGQFLNSYMGRGDESYSGREDSDMVQLLQSYVEKLRSVTRELSRTASHPNPAFKKTKNTPSAASSLIQRNKDMYRTALSVNSTTAASGAELCKDVLQAYSSVTSRFNVGK